jgi:hypothetical protein
VTFILKIQRMTTTENIVWGPITETIGNLLDGGPQEYSEVVRRFRHCATSWKVAGSSPDEVDIFNLPTSLNSVLGPTQPLSEMSTRNLPGEVKAAGA